MIIPKPTRGKTPIDHAGKRFGRLVVLEYVGRRVTNPRRNCGLALWRCKCDCGNETVVISHSLVDGTTKSCGCWSRQSLRGGNNILPTGESAFNQLFYGYKKSARQRGYEFTLSREEFRSLTQQSCYYCGADPSVKFRAAEGTNGNYIGNGIDRADNAKGYIISNVRPCCKQCNISKGTLSEEEFLDWLNRASTRQARFEHGAHGR